MKDRPRKKWGDGWNTHSSRTQRRQGTRNGTRLRRRVPTKPRKKHYPRPMRKEMRG